MLPSVRNAYGQQPHLFAVHAAAFLKDTIDSNRPVSYDWNLCNLYLKRTTFIDHTAEKPSDGVIPVRYIPPGCDYTHIDLIRYLCEYGTYGWDIDQATVDFDRDFREEDAIPCKSLEIVTIMKFAQLKKIKRCADLTDCSEVKLTAMAFQFRELALEAVNKDETSIWNAKTSLFIAGTLKKEVVATENSGPIKSCYEIFHELVGILICEEFRNFLNVHFGRRIVIYLQTDDSQGESLHEIYSLYKDKLLDLKRYLPSKCLIRVVTHTAWLKLLHEGAAEAPYYEA